MISQVLFIAAFASIAAASIMPIAHAPQPYKFGYDIKDKHSEQYRQESGNGAGGVAGSYGFTDARGVKRQVDYVADHAGFRAAVKTNEPGTANQNPAAVQMISAAPYAGGVAALGGVGLGYGGIADGRLGLGGIRDVGLNNGIGLNGVGFVSGVGLGGVGLVNEAGLRGIGLANGLGLGGIGLANGVGLRGIGLANGIRGVGLVNGVGIL